MPPTLKNLLRFRLANADNDTDENAKEENLFESPDSTRDSEDRSLRWNRGGRSFGMISGVVLYENFRKPVVRHYDMLSKLISATKRNPKNLEKAKQELETLGVGIIGEITPKLLKTIQARIKKVGFSEDNPAFRSKVYDIAGRIWKDESVIAFWQDKLSKPNLKMVDNWLAEMGIETNDLRVDLLQNNSRKGFPSIKYGKFPMWLDVLSGEYVAPKIKNKDLESMRAQVHVMPPSRKKTELMFQLGMRRPTGDVDKVPAWQREKEKRGKEMSAMGLEEDAIVEYPTLGPKLSTSSTNTWHALNRTHDQLEESPDEIEVNGKRVAKWGQADSVGFGSMGDNHFWAKHGNHPKIWEEIVSAVFSNDINNPSFKKDVEYFLDEAGISHKINDISSLIKLVGQYNKLSSVGTTDLKAIRKKVYSVAGRLWTDKKVISVWQGGGSAEEVFKSIRATGEDMAGYKIEFADNQGELIPVEKAAGRLEKGYVADAGEEHTMNPIKKDMLKKAGKLDIKNPLKWKSNMAPWMRDAYQQVAEDITEAYPSNFSMEEFNAIKSYRGKMKYASERLKRLGAGSSRVVYQIDDKKVLKLAKNEKGLAQNNVETDGYLAQQDITANTFNYDEQHDRPYWVEMELAIPLNRQKKRFKELTGFSHEDIYKLLNHIGKHYKWPENDNLTGHNDLSENEFLNSIYEIAMTMDMPLPGDFAQTSSWGEVKRDGKSVPVLIDFGFTNDVRAHYYAR
jgi:mRNA-degrading endonuclease RelE of RelBE toxin-antitoxin system